MCCDAATQAWSAQQGHSLPHLSPDCQSVGTEVMETGSSLTTAFPGVLPTLPAPFCRPWLWHWGLRNEWDVRLLCCFLLPRGPFPTLPTGSVSEGLEPALSPLPGTRQDLRQVGKAHTLYLVLFPHSFPDQSWSSRRQRTSRTYAVTGLSETSPSSARVTKGSRPGLLEKTDLGGDG